MMKIKNKTDLAIFTELEKINNNLKLFTLENGSNLDMIFNEMYSERTLLNAEKTNSNYAIMVNALFSKKWDSAFDLFDTANLSMSNLGVHNSRDRTITENITDTQNELNSISAYNVEEFSNDDKNAKDYNRDKKVIENVISADTDINNFSVSWEYLQKNYIQDIIFNDVISVISLRIYESEEN